jgi:D-serine deaminase-like pyridoxal phosphate-dependent protein
MYDRLRRAIAAEPLPLALVDLDAFDDNTDRLLAPVRKHQKKLRVATKSLRCLALIRRIQARAGDVARGLMSFAVPEAAMLIDEGFDDVFGAYPTGQAVHADRLAQLNRDHTVSICADSIDHLELFDAAGRKHGTKIPIVLEVDLSYRPLEGAVHLGVRRSPLHGADALLALAEKIERYPGIRFYGVMGYEAQIAGLPDQKPFARVLKQLSRRPIAESRRRIFEGLSARGLHPEIVNGGGTGSLASSTQESALTEVTIGSGFLDPLLFDGYDDLSLRPAAYFALEVVRHPAPDLIACHGGGYVASGEPGPDRLPRPALPPGLSLLSFEGAGEVQTPLKLASHLTLPLGAPVFFRHAKAGELAEHFREYVLIHGDRIAERALTYRGMGRSFL